MFQHRSIIEIQKETPFTISVEMFPPRNGISPEVIFKKISLLRYLNVDFISITKGAMGSMRGGTVPIGFMIGDRFNVEPLVHFRCRDHTKQSVENHLVDHHYFGIRNVMALMGDVAADGSNAELDPKSFHRHADQLVDQIRRMNEGEYMPLPGVDDARKGVSPDFCIGVAAYPEAEDMDFEINTVMRSKVEAGADFAITQMFFTSQAYFEYVDRLKGAGLNIPVIPGVRPMSTRRHIDVAKDTFKAQMPSWFQDKVVECDDKEVPGVCRDFTLDLISELKEGGAPGVHLFVLNDVQLAHSVIPHIRTL